MADRPCAREIPEILLAEHLPHQTHAPPDPERRTLLLGRDNSGTLLPTMLEGIEAIVGQLGGVGMPEHPEDPTFMFRMVGSLQDSFLGMGKSFEKRRLRPEHLG